MAEKNPAVRAAKKVATGTVYTFNSGVKAKVHKLSQSLVNDVVNALDEPMVPQVFDADSQRHVPNPSDPEYIAAVRAYEKQQINAMLDACWYFGLELVAPMPDAATWLPGLKFMSKRGHLDLSGYDLDDAAELEFLYKRYVVADIEEINTLMPTMIEGVTEEDVQKARDSFRGDADGEAHS